MKVLFRTLLAATILFISLLPLPAIAQTQQEVDELREEVRELSEEIARLRAAAPADAIAELDRKIDILTRKIESMETGTTPVHADQFQAGLGQAASKVYRAEPGLSLGGYGEMVYENREGTSDQIDFLRAILYTGYKFNDRVVFNSEIEFEHATSGDGIGEVSVEFAYLDFMLREQFNARVGMMLVPMGLVNELHEPTAFFGVLRPAVERSIIPTTWRENGAGIYGSSGPLTYRAYLLNGFRADEFSASGIRGGRQKGGKALADDFALVTRLDWAPAEGLLLGGSLYTGDSGQNLSVDVGTTIVELHGTANLRGWRARALWADTSLDDVAELNGILGLSGSESIGDEMTGWYAELGYDLTTLYEMPGAGLSPFVRYEELDTQKSVPTGFSRNPTNDRQLLTIGLAWQPIDQTVIKFDYQIANDGTEIETNQFNLGMGYIF